MYSVRFILVTLCATLILGGCVAKKDYEEVLEEKQDVQSELNETKEQKDARIDELMEQIASMEQEISNLKDIHQAKVDELNRQVDDLKVLTEKQEEAVDDLTEQADQLEQSLQEEIERGEITLKRYKTKMIINMDNSILFDSGSAVLKKPVRKTLDKIADSLNTFQENNIQIEGHTDNVPISTRKFPSNWELSAARALAVLKYFVDNAETEPRRLSAVGYGEFHPIAPNDSPENRKLNRRVDIVILPK